MRKYINHPGAFASVTNEDLAQAGVRTSVCHHSDDDNTTEEVLDILRGAVGYAEMEGGFCTPPYWYTDAKNAIDKADRIKRNTKGGGY